MICLITLNGVLLIIDLFTLYLKQQLLQYFIYLNVLFEIHTSNNFEWKMLAITDITRLSDGSISSSSLYTFSSRTYDQKKLSTFCSWYKGEVAHGISRSINFPQYFCCCFIVFLYMSAGCVSTFRSCVQGYLEWLPFVIASHLHFTL